MSADQPSAEAAASGHRAFDFAHLGPRERYKLLIGTVVPRPIALVTTKDREGRVNAAPFSFFNCLSHDPAILALGLENWPDQGFKDTTANIRATDVFVVNIVDMALFDGMVTTAVAFDREVDELEKAGLTPVPGDHVDCPRIAQSPAAFECRRHVSLAIGPAREIVLGEVLGMHVREDLVDIDNLRIDQGALDAVGRMGGAGYATTRDRFERTTPSPEEWEARRRSS